MTREVIVMRMSAVGCQQISVNHSYNEGGVRKTIRF